MKWLMNKKMKLSKNQKGLTLVELLAVIVILGVIAAIAVPSIGGIISNSKAKADAESITLITNAVELYTIDVAPDNTAAALITPTTLQAAGYLKTVPMSQVDPTKGFTTTVTEADGVYTILVAVAT